MAAAKIKLILGSHAHVPYGSNNAEFENVYARLMRPFVTSLYKYPGLQAVLHYSGVLLHWVERSHPELFMLINDMIARKQAEILGGGFYEPMLPIIPLQDKIGQIELLTTYIRKQFGKRPQGCWIPGYAWEQGLVSPLASCGMGFTFLGSRQFALAGGKDSPCVCEDQGKLITVFPVSRSIEEDLAKKSFQKSINSINNDGGGEPDGIGRIISIFPDKLNTGPDGSADWAWGNFFDELSKCESFVETVSPGRLLKNLKGIQKLCVPDSTRDADSVPPRRFIIENPEAGGIYSKMIFTNVLINQLRGDKSRKLSAHEELWKAQGSDLFSSTGQRLRSHVIRNAAYASLLRAEQVTRDKGKFAPSLVPFDFNLDGVEEWLFQDAKINCYVQSVGGGIFELDYQPKAWNYLDTCGGRTAFADLLLPKDAAPETAEDENIKGASAARLCYNERYELVELDKVRRKLLLLLRQAPAAGSAPVGAFGNVEIEKSYQIKKDTIHVGYTITNKGASAEVFQFAPRIDLALPGEGETFARFYSCKPGAPDAPVSKLMRDVDCLKIHDIKNEVQITLSCGKPFGGRVVPVYLNDSDKGEKLYQAYCAMPVFPITLEAGGAWEAEFTLKFSH